MAAERAEEEKDGELPACYLTTFLATDGTATEAEEAAPSEALEAPADAAQASAPTQRRGPPSRKRSWERTEFTYWCFP